MLRHALSILSLSLCLVACLPGRSKAQSSALSAVPHRFSFDGSYVCEGSFANGGPHRSSFTGATILGGKWIELTEQDTMPATGYVAKYLIGYDSQRKQLVEFDANNFGAATYASLDGWKENVLTMTSPVSEDAKAPYAADRFIYSMTGTEMFTVDWQVRKTASSAWVPADHLSCARVVAKK